MRLANRNKARGRLKRRAYPIHAYVGPNGTGKSLLAVYDTLLSLEFGRPCLSTVRLLDFRNPHPCPGGPVCDDPAGHHILRNEVAVVDGRLEVVEVDTGRVHAASHPLYIRFTHYEQLLGWRDGDVLMDEVQGVASSREIASMPVQVANFLMQLRRRNIALRWSTPAWGRADKIIREVTQGVTLASAFLPARPRRSDGPPRLWAERRVIVARTYDPTKLDEFEAHRADRIPTEGWAAYWRPGMLAEIGYDTYDAVTALGWANDAGLCMVCGGKRSHPACSCADHKGRRGGRGAVASSPAGAATTPHPPTPLPAPTAPLHLTGAQVVDALMGGS